MSTSHLYLNQLFTRKCVALSGSSLLVYDYLITVSPEVEYIWKAPWTVVKAVFLLNRYGNLVGQTVITLGEIGFLSHGSQEFCVAFCLYSTLFMFLSNESIRFTMMMRAWAIWGCTYRVALWLIWLYVLYLVTMIAVACYMWEDSYASPPVGGVCLAVIPTYSWLLWFARLAVDSIVLVMVCYSIRESFMRPRGSSTSPLIRLLVRDALSFCAASVFNSGFSIICWTIFRHDPRAFLQLVFSVPMLSIAGQRLVLNLRGLRAGPCTSSDVSRVVDRQLLAMGDEECWHPVDGLSPGTGTTERPA